MNMGFCRCQCAFDGMKRAACFETRAFRALLSMRYGHATHHILILRSDPKDRVSKDAKE
jgi:hypothetical protein